MIQYRLCLVATLALPAAALLAACGSASPPSAARTTAPATTAPAATTPADPCEAQITWRDSGGITEAGDLFSAMTGDLTGQCG